MTALPEKHYRGHCKAIEINQRTPGKEDLGKDVWKQVSSKAGGRWRPRRQHRTELDGQK